MEMDDSGAGAMQPLHEPRLVDPLDVLEVILEQLEAIQLIEAGCSSSDVGQRERLPAAKNLALAVETGQGLEQIHEEGATGSTRSEYHETTRLFREEAPGVQATDMR